MICPKCKVEMECMGIVAEVGKMPYYLNWVCFECREEIRVKIKDEDYTL